MKRFTQYLYEYRQSEKVKNIGFVKGRTGKRWGENTDTDKGAFLFSDREVESISVL